MDDLIWRSLQGNTSPEEEAAIERWRAEASPNEQRYEELTGLWDAASTVEPAKRATRRPSTDEILHESSARERPPGGRWRTGLSQRRWLLAGTAAAAAVVLTFGAVQLFRDTLSDRAQEVVTSQGETASVRLADGSVVRLGPGSLLRLPERTGARDVWLDGRAFFAVANQDGDRFTVQSAGGRTTALGTRFEMQTSEDEFRVVVVEGKVAVEAHGGRVEGGAGEVIYVVDDVAPAVARVENPRALLDWMEGMLAFQDTPLRRVVEEIEAEYGVQIEVADSALADRVVTAFFLDQPVEAVVTVVCQVVDAACSLGGDRITMELPVR